MSNCKKLSLHKLGDSAIVTIPEARNGKAPVMKFTNHKNKLMRPYIVYADTECSVIPSDDTNRIVTHAPNSACIYFAVSYTHLTLPTILRV